MANEYYQTPENGNEYTAPAEAPVQAPVQAPAANPAKDLIQKIMGDKKLLIAAAGGIVVLIIALIVIISLIKGPNKYTTPLDLQMDVQNAKTYKAYEKASLSLTNGLADSEMKDLLKIMKKSDEYDAEDEAEDFEEEVEDLIDEYGKNYKFYYEIEDKDKIDKDDLKDAEDELQDEARDMYKQIKNTDLEDLEDSFDEMGLSKSDAKKVKKLMEGFYKDLKEAKISAGYELEVTYYVKGSELDKPEERYETTVYVYKVDGRWVTLNNLKLNLF